MLVLQLFRFAHSTKLTGSVGGTRDVEVVVDSTAGQVATAEGVQGPVVELGDVTDDHGSGEKTKVLEAILLSSLGADDGLLGSCGAALAQFH